MHECVNGRGRLSVIHEQLRTSTGIPREGADGGDVS